MGQDAGGPEALAIEIVTTQIGVGDLLFDVRTAGPEDGEVVILLHGFPQTSYEWRHQLRALGAAGFRAVAPDQRGYSPGARPEGIDAYAIPLLVADVLGLSDAIGAERFHIVGHDWGAAIAWALAVAVPDRVITANPVSVPHPDAFSRVLNDPTSCQPEASAYFDLFVQPDSEDGFLADDHAQLRGIFAGIENDAIDEYRAKVNVIPLNEAPSLPYRRPSDAAINRFAARARRPRDHGLGTQESGTGYPSRLRSADRRRQRHFTSTGDGQSPALRDPASEGGSV